MSNKKKTPQPEAPAPKKVDNRKIRNTVYNAYAKDGMQAAFKLAESYGCKYEFCKACDCETPVIKHDCLICGQTTAPAPISREVEGDENNRPKPEKCYAVETNQGAENCVFPACHCGLPQDMSNPLFTKGEWKVKKLGRNNEGVYQASVWAYNLLGQANGVCNTHGRTQQEADANARLIASAPTLYRENQRLKKELESWKEEHFEIVERAANTVKELQEGNQQQAKDIELLREALQGLHTACMMDSDIPTAWWAKHKETVATAYEALKQTEPKQ